MRELTQEEINQVDGGILPLIAFGLALGGKLTATGLAGWAFGLRDWCYRHTWLLRTCQTTKPSVLRGQPDSILQCRVGVS